MVPHAAGASPGRPQLIRAINERLLLEHIRNATGVSRAELARISSLSKNTVSLALANLERTGLVRPTGVRTGQPGPAALLYEVHPDAAYVLALDVGRHYLRGAIGDFSGAVRASATVKSRSASGQGRVAELIQLADKLCAAVGIGGGHITQTVLGSPGVYDPQRDALVMAGTLPGWDKPRILAELREAFGADLMIENDVDAAAMAERTHGHGRDMDSFAFVWIGTGIGMGLVLNGRLHRGAHGAAGEIAYLPLDWDGRQDARGARDARKRGSFEAAASADGIVRAAHAAGIRGPISARQVFQAAERGDERAARVVAEEALLVARAVGAVISVVDPHLVVLGGGVSQANGFRDAVEAHLRQIAPVLPELRISALGTDAVVDGCLAAGTERIWSVVSAGAPADSADATPSGEKPPVVPEPRHHAAHRPARPR